MARGLKELLDERKDLPTVTHADLERLVRDFTRLRRIAQGDADEAKLAQLGATQAERDMMEEFVQRIGGLARVLNEIQDKYREAYNCLDGIAKREAELARWVGEH